VIEDGTGSSGDDPHVVIPTSATPQVTEVRVYDSTFTHIGEQHGAQLGSAFTHVGERHGVELGSILRLPAMSQAITSAIESPTHIEPGNPGSLKFVDTASTNIEGEPLKLLVKVVSGTSGRLQTLYFAPLSSTAIATAGGKD
jgi:hypothetical protein